MVNHEPIKPLFKLRQTLLKTTKKAIKRLPSVTLIMSLLTTKVINKPTSTKRKVCIFKHTELHSDSLRDKENSTNLVIGEPLTNATLVPFSLIFVGNITSSSP